MKYGLLILWVILSAKRNHLYLYAGFAVCAAWIYRSVLFGYNGSEVKNMDLRKTGALIRALRREMNMTQKQLADKLNLSAKTISKWECGSSHS